MYKFYVNIILSHIAGVGNDFFPEEVQGVDLDFELRGGLLDPKINRF